MMDRDLIAGALTAGMYFTANNPDEIELRELVDALYRRIDWRWAQDGADTIRQGWKPECGFLHYGWEGYSEAILLYALAVGSPTHPLDGDCYDAWTATYQWENLYGYDFLYAGPLFVHQFSHAWIDLRGIQDRFMREKRRDYFEQSPRAASQRDTRRNQSSSVTTRPLGPTACDGPTDERRTSNERGACPGMPRAVPYGPDDGTLPPAALACCPSPAIALRAAHTRIAIPTCGPDSGTRAVSIRPCWRRRRPGSPGHFGLIRYRGHDDRKPSHATDLAADVGLPWSHRFAARRVPRRLARDSDDAAADSLRRLQDL
jgi:hypothetical protein